MARRSRRNAPVRPVTASAARFSAVSPLLFATIVGIVLTMLFWGTLWLGGGFVGGDVYTYYLPQKALLADELADGRIPLWNDRTGFGYPVLGESQTGAAYPPYVIAYSLLSLNTAYSAIHLAHYVWAFVGFFAYLRSAGFRVSSSLLAAAIITYGWFPPRCCWEWAIVTGAWLPWALVCVEAWIARGQTRYLCGLALILFVQLLAGHYQIAFFTVIAVLVTGSFRRRHTDDAMPLDSSTPPLVKISARHELLLPGAILIGFLLAGPQLTASWELKQRSDRSDADASFAPAYGHVPPSYFGQLLLPWSYYQADGRDVAAELSHSSALSVRAETNKVEAHLYWGILSPVALLAAVLLAFRRKLAPCPTAIRWAWLGVVAAIYATGWLMPVAEHIPGFGFFRGAGRIGLLTTIAVAFWIARSSDWLLTRIKAGHVAVGLFMLVTIGDLWLVSRVVTYSFAVPFPPIAQRDESPLRSILQGEVSRGRLVRLLAPGNNLVNVLGIAAVPPYLGFAPSVYVEEATRMPDLPELNDRGERPASAELNAWLRSGGVTHVLSFEPLVGDSSATDQWDAELIWVGSDPVINPAMARFDGPIYLSRLRNAYGRIHDGDGPIPITITQSTPGRIAFETLPEYSGGTIILTDLADPGWSVTVDGEPAAWRTSGGKFREIDVPAGGHDVVWKYAPRSVYWGGLLSLTGLLLLGGLAMFGRPLWRRRTRKSVRSRDHGK